MWHFNIQRPSIRFWSLVYSEGHTNSSAFPFSCMVPRALSVEPFQSERQSLTLIKTVLLFQQLSIVQQVDPVTRWYSTIGQCKSAEDTWRDLMAGADSGMPSEPLSWLPTRDLTGFAWDGDECRGHQFAQWLQWISDNILKHWDLQLEGHVWYQGTDDFLAIVAPQLRSST